MLTCNSAKPGVPAGPHWQHKSHASRLVLRAVLQRLMQLQRAYIRTMHEASDQRIIRQLPAVPCTDAA